MEPNIKGKNDYDIKVNEEVYIPICSKCKREIKNINLTISHYCNSDKNISIIKDDKDREYSFQIFNKEFPYEWDIPEENQYFCFNPFKKIHINEFYNQIEFKKINKRNDRQTKNKFKKFKENAQIIIGDIIDKYFYCFEFSKELSGPQFFNESIAMKIKKNVLEMFNTNIDSKIAEKMKIFILDIYFLILVIKKNPFILEGKKRIDYYSTENLEKYFYYYIKLEEIQKKINTNGYIITDKDISKIFYIENKYYLLFSESKILLYDILQNHYLYSLEYEHFHAAKIFQINNKKFLIISYYLKESFILTIDDNSSMKMSISLLNNYITDADSLDDNRIICMNYQEIFILMETLNNNYFVSNKKSVNSDKYTFLYIYSDKINNQFLTLGYNGQDNLSLNFYDLESFNLKKTLYFKGENYYIPKYTLQICDKELYILLYNNSFILISRKYLEVISIFNYYDEIYDNSSYFMLPNSLNIFLKRGAKIKRYKLINNDIKFEEEYVNDAIKLKNTNNEYYYNENDENYYYDFLEIIELKEVNKNGDFIILAKKHSFIYEFSIITLIDNECLNQTGGKKHIISEGSSSQYFIDKSINNKSKNSLGNFFSDFRGWTDSIIVFRDERPILVKKKDKEFYDANLEEIKYQEPGWKPKTNLGKLSKLGKIYTLDHIFYDSIPIKEHQIVDCIRYSKYLLEECLLIKIVQKPTKINKRTKYKAILAVGDKKGHIGIGEDSDKEKDIALKKAVIKAKLNIIPIRRGYFKNNIGEPHTIYRKIIGECGGIKLELIPAQRGTGIVGVNTSKKIFELCGIEDIIIKTFGKSNEKENFIKAIYNALYKSYKYPTLDLQLIGCIRENPFSEYKDDLKRY